MLTSPFSPEHMSGDEDSSEDEEYATPLATDTTASGSTTAEIPPSTAGAVEDESHSTISPLVREVPDLPPHEVLLVRARDAPQRIDDVAASHPHEDEQQRRERRRRERARPSGETPDPSESLSNLDPLHREEAAPS